MKKKVLIYLLILMAFFSSGCKQRIYDLKAELKLGSDYVVAGDLINIDLLFDLGNNESLNFNGIIFIKFYNNSGELEFMNAHRPPYKMTDWVPGSRIKYSRLIEIPEDISEGEYKISLGIYNPSKNFKTIKINSPLFINGESYMGKINIIKVLYGAGFYPLERTKFPNLTSRWVSNKAVAYIKNPRKDIILSLKLSAPPQYFSGSYQKTKILINENLIDTIEFSSASIINKEYKIKANLMGKEKLVELKFLSDREFVPKNLGINPDTRNLSILLIDIEFKNIR